MRFAPPNPLRIADRASGLNAPTVRSYNERLVLSLLLQSSGISRLEIGEKTGLSAQTVSVIVRSLEQEGLVSKGEAQRGRVGPPTIPLSLNPEGAFSVGVSFGEEASNVALIDFAGKVRYHAAHPYSSLQESSATIAAKVEEGLLTLPRDSRTRVAGIGLAVPDDASTSGQIRKLLGRDLADVQANIERKLGLSVYIQNEITAAAGGESLFGMARSLSDFLFFYLGSRLHSRLILNYQIHSGRSDLSHDVGLLALLQGLKTHGLTLSDVESTNFPDAAGELYARWQEACCRQISESVRSLLSFVNFKSVVLSSYAPPVLAHHLCESLHKELPDIEFLLGANSTAPKAIGAASLPYHSRFMVQ
ncbi:sugar kinase [Bradyrhizobium genosp. SA-3]|uniref:ROK family transcriptional regulator n=1 Tax=Bradyrhizobium genosp. SA-3 TaxID=508868 RepID=UPI001029944B|nr:ROK family transcriptional regulator [Bradyrhizobium genosp. SA-3]RZM94052.1 sugar kinase [Bradyrhizobium genosp. SA-3]